MQDFIYKLKSKNPDLKEAELIGLLYIINSKDHISNNDLITLTGIPKNILKTFKSSIAGILKEANRDIVELNEEGLGLISELDLKPYKWSLLSYDFKEFEDEVSKIREKYQIKQKRDYDQFFATPNSTVGKAKILMDKGMVQGKRIAFIGDDDLVSVALGFMAPEYAGIKVFDIDPEVTGTIGRIVKERGFSDITAEVQDVRKPFLKSEENNYDVVFIDPPYTKTGAQLFLHRAVELLIKRKTFEGSYIIFNFGAGIKNPDIKIKIQDIINQYNLVIEDRIDKFTRYKGAETVGNTSAIYVLKATKHTTSEGKVLSEQIYTFEKTEIENFPYVDHFVLKIQRIPGEIIKSKTKLSKILGQFCNKHKLKVVDTKVTKFKKGGPSFTYILATSNLVVHTWPEKNSAHIDLITCVPIHNKALLGETLSKLFRTNHIEIRKIE